MTSGGRSISIDWREAFAHHPRIGEAEHSVAEKRARRSWAAGEQASVATAQDAVRDALVEANIKYERRFGYIYIVCATGKTADEMLALARGRLHNSAKVELRVAAEEQRKITRLAPGEIVGRRGRIVSTLSTHVLDTALGKPAAAIRVTLMRANSDEIVWQRRHRTVTGAFATFRRSTLRSSRASTA